jgi:hypothetical protein
MKRKEETTPQKEPTIEYIVVEDESNILERVFNELFERVEKEIR